MLENAQTKTRRRTGTDELGVPLALDGARGDLCQGAGVTEGLHSLANMGFFVDGTSNSEFRSWASV